MSTSVMTPTERKHYEDCLAAGTSPTLAEMFALGSAPGANTDREFLHGECNGSQFAAQPEVGDRYAAHARRAGISIKGRKYIAGLARYPGDPRAWVSGKGDAQAIIDQEGWGAEGMISRPVTKVAEPREVAVAEDIVQREVAEVLEAVPAGEKAPPVEAVREQVIAKRKGHWCK